MALEKIKLDGKGSLTEQIKRAISNAIVNGDFLANDLLPSEVALAEHFNISRQTVHKAMAALGKDGLVIRRKKAGTIVAAQKAFLMPIEDISEQILRKGQKYDYKILDRRVFINGENGHDWPMIEVGTRCEMLKCLHFANNEAIQFEFRVVNLEVAKAFEFEKFEQISPTKWLFKQVPWSNVAHQILAVGADEEMAKYLSCKLHEPCLVVQRTTMHDDQFITFAKLSSVGAMHHLEGSHHPLK